MENQDRIHANCMCTGVETYEFKSWSRVVSTSKLAPDWLPKSEQPIKSQLSKLTQLLTMTTTHKFPPQRALRGATEYAGGGAECTCTLGRGSQSGVDRVQVGVLCAQACSAQFCLGET